MWNKLKNFFKRKKANPEEARVTLRAAVECGRHAIGHGMAGAFTRLADLIDQKLKGEITAPWEGLSKHLREEAEGVSKAVHADMLKLPEETQKEMSEIANFGKYLQQVKELDEMLHRVGALKDDQHLDVTAVVNPDGELRNKHRYLKGGKQIEEKKDEPPPPTEEKKPFFKMNPAGGKN